MRFRTMFTICWGLAIAASLPGPATGQALSQPDGWQTRAERFVAMPPGFHITTSPSVLFYHPDAQAEGEYQVYSDGFLFPGDSPNPYGLVVGADEVEFHVNGEAVAGLPRADLSVDGVVGFRVGAGLNLHLTTLTIARGDHLERWAPVAEQPEEGGT